MYTLWALVTGAFQSASPQQSGCSETKCNVMEAGASVRQCIPEPRWLPQSTSPQRNNAVCNIAGVRSSTVSASHSVTLAQL